MVTEVVDKVVLPTLILKPFSPFINDMRENGWIMTEDAAIIGPELEIVSYFLEDESSVSGKIMMDRAIYLCHRAGQQHAERFLRQQEEVPVEWRHYLLIFPGTEWVDKKGTPHVPYLIWRKDRWKINWRSLKTMFPSHSRLVRYK